MYFKLDENKNVVPCSLEEWGHFFNVFKNRTVKVDTIKNKTISTVFIGVKSLTNNSIIFETMIFNDKGDDIYTRRYDTYFEAEEGHQCAIEWVKNGCADT